MLAHLILLFVSRNPGLKIKRELYDALRARRVPAARVRIYASNLAKSPMAESFPISRDRLTSLGSHVQTSGRHQLKHFEPSPIFRFFLVCGAIAAAVAAVAADVKEGTAIVVYLIVFAHGRGGALFNSKARSRVVVDPVVR